MNAADKISKTYYHKILNLSKVPQLSRVSDVDIDKKLLEALKLSHKHLTAKNMAPVFTKKKFEGQINKDSIVYYFYNKKELADKNFIYDELTNINKNWEFSIVTLI